jgi:chemotaxis protein CheD
MASILVDIAGMKTASGAANELATHTLGSCVAVAVYDPVKKAGGLLHYMLPEASLDPDKARQSPYMFADTGIPLLFRAVYQLGAERERIIVKMAGGANVMEESGALNMGKRNCQAARRIFHKNGLLVAAELVGGVSGKTMRLRLKDGSVEVQLPGGEVRIL